MGIHQFEISSNLSVAEALDRLKEIVRKPQTIREQLPWNRPRLWHPDKASFIGVVENNYFSFVPNYYERMAFGRMSIRIKGYVEADNQCARIVFTMMPELSTLILATIWLGYGLLVTLAIAIAISPLKAMLPLAFFGLPSYWAYRRYASATIDSQHVLLQNFKA